jgi:hypothetical protein
MERDAGRGGLHVRDDVVDRITMRSPEEVAQQVAESERVSSGVEARVGGFDHTNSEPSTVVEQGPGRLPTRRLPATRPESAERPLPRVHEVHELERM